MRFIVVDGLDGAGKDTQAKKIMERYKVMGEKVILRSHPESDNKYGWKAKEALLGKGKKNHLKASVYYALDVIRSIRKYYGKSDTFIVVRYLVGVAYLPFPVAKILYLMHLYKASSFSTGACDKESRFLYTIHVF